MRDQGFRYHFMAEVERHGWDHVRERALSEAAESTDHLFISLDIDVLDPAYARGTGTPEHNGLTPRELFPLLRRPGAEHNLVGIELVELNPLVDPTYVTPLVANRCARAILTGSRCAARAITEPHYLAPEGRRGDRQRRGRGQRATPRAQWRSLNSVAALPCAKRGMCLPRVMTKGHDDDR